MLVATHSQPGAVAATGGHERGHERSTRAGSVGRGETLVTRARRTVAQRDRNWRAEPSATTATAERFGSAVISGWTLIPMVIGQGP